MAGYVIHVGSCFAHASLPFEGVGRIAAGPDAGRFVPVRDDRDRTGGSLISRSSAADVFSTPGVFASWVERREDLGVFFSDAGWAVEWRPRPAVR